MLMFHILCLKKFQYSSQIFIRAKFHNLKEHCTKLRDLEKITDILNWDNQLQPKK
jgi:hypothetical protein